MEYATIPEKKSKICFSKSYSSHDLLYGIFKQLNLDRKSTKTFCDVSVTNHSLELCAHKCILWISGCFQSISALEYIIKIFSEFAKYICEAFLELVEAIYKFGKIRFSWDNENVEKLVDDLSELKSYLDLQTVTDLLKSKCISYTSYEEYGVVTRNANDYKSQLIKMIQRLNSDRSSASGLCDATLVCADEQFCIHKCIVGCASDYFKTLFTTKLNGTETNVFDLKTVNIAEVKQVLDCVYAFEITLSEDNVCDVTAVSDYYMLPKLKDLCSDFLCSNINNESFNEVCCFAETYNLKVVIGKVAEYFHANLWAVSSESWFQSLTLDALQKLVQMKCYHRCEEVVFAALLRWIKHNLDDRQQHVSVLTQLLSYEKLSLEFLKNVLPAELHSDPITTQMLECLKQQVNAEKAFEIYFASNWMFTNDFLSEDTVVLKYNILKDKWHEVGSCAPPDCEKIDLSSRLYKIELASVFLDACYYVIGVNGRMVFRLRVTDDELIWEEVASLLEFRSTKAAAVLSNKIYICGGIDLDEEAMSSCECYDPETDMWHQIAPLLNRRCFHSMVATDQRIYIFGGSNICDDVFDILRAMNRSDEDTVPEDRMPIDCFDPQSNEWSCLEPSVELGTDEDDVISVAYKNDLIFYEHRNSFFGFGKFNIPAKTWSFMEKPDGARYINCVILVDKLYAVCKDFKNQVCLYDYDFSDESWCLSNVMASIGTCSSMSMLFSPVKAIAIDAPKESFLLVP